ncbi:MAG: tripartite tricarboxylate transporter permease [Candidatus Thermoplasmatota archaeon]|nr:tripartite tricarboxylate transporter permease [Candidatus Thermoplasmatota archaeon]
MSEILLMLLLIMLSAVFYMLIGFLPGTDETATMAPIAMILLISGMDPVLVFAWFIGAIVAFKTSDSIPVALMGIPGGVMAVPQVPDAIIAKKNGLADVILRKGIVSSVIGTYVAIAVAFSLSYFLMPFTDWLGAENLIAGVGVPRWFWILFAGLIIIATSSKNKVLAFLIIPSFALLVEGLRGIYGKPVSISFFLGITIGPMMLELFSSFMKDYRKSIEREGKLEVRLHPIGKISLNPFKHVTKEETIYTTIFGTLSTFLATVISPVGLTILFGDLLKTTKKNEVEASVLAYTVRDGIKNAAYIGGIVIPLVVIGAATGPMSAGPAGPFFLDLGKGMSASSYLSSYSIWYLAIIALIAATISLLIVYPVLLRYSRKIALFLFKHVSAEALYALFIAIVLLLAYDDAGIAGIFGVLLVSIISGALVKAGVSLGLLFMILVAAPIVTQILLTL